MQTLVHDRDAQTFVRQSREQLRDWRRWLAGMKLEVGRKAEEARTRLRNDIEDLSTQRDALERRLHQARQVADEGWSDAMDDLRSAMQDFTGAAARTYYLVTK